MGKIIAESLGTVYIYTHTLYLVNEEREQNEIIYKNKKIVIES